MSECPSLHLLTVQAFAPEPPARLWICCCQRSEIRLLGQAVLAAAIGLEKLAALVALKAATGFDHRHCDNQNCRREPCLGQAGLTLAWLRFTLSADFSYHQTYRRSLELELVFTSTRPAGCQLLAEDFGCLSLSLSEQGC